MICEDVTAFGRAATVALGLSLAFSGLATAAERKVEAGDSSFSLSGSVGLMWIKAGEYVYYGPDTDRKLSQLDWESSNVPVFEGTVRIELPKRFLLKAGIEVAAGGDGYMTDYDWIEPFTFSDGPDDWSHRSQHDTTNLDHFWGGSLALGYRVLERDGFNLELLAGGKYRDTQWSAYGGDFIYSTKGFRDTVFSNPEDVIGITYRQKIPSAFVGLDAALVHGPWTLTGSAAGGLTIGAVALDNHWQRPLIFREDLDSAATLALAADVAYALTDRVSLHLGGGYDEMFKTRSDSATFDPKANSISYSQGETGASQRTFRVTTGFSGRF